ncbi:ParB N-terminal domain-containing protein, partial [Novosphingobium sp. B-7]|uniref:ParB N-terminal domain-containing protein n=1 Tax=Novosphingobium sp. B-7 TaxID=1298855 RepID=UPI001ED9B42A
MSGEDGVKAPVKRAALGRGLGALLGETRREESLVRPAPAATGGTPAAAVPARATTGVALLSVAEIEPHPDQPRRHFDEEALDELAQSIAARGVIQPVIVRPMAGGRYQLVA